MKKTKGKRQRRGNKSHYSGVRSDGSNIPTGAKGSNAPLWHGSPELLLAAASFPYAYVSGKRVPWNNPILETLPSKQGNYFVNSGLATLNVCPVYGAPEDAQAPINVAAQAEYSFTRHANSGARNYYAPDQMLFFAAMDQVFAYINWLERIYGNARKFLNINRYVGEAVLLAEGVDADDIRKNLLQFYGRINVLIDKAAQFAVPANLTIYQRHAAMFQGFYAEGESVKDQLYAFMPSHFYYFDLINDAGALIPKLAPRFGYGLDHYASVDELITFGEDMIKRIISDDDFGLMSGDILKAYQGNIIKLQSLQLEYQAPITTDLYMLESFKNATVVPTVAPGALMHSATKGYLIQAVQAVYHAPAPDRRTENTFYYVGQKNALRTLLENRIITTIRVNPTPADTMEMTRLVVGAKDYTDNSTGDVIESVCSLVCSTEVAMSASYWNWTYNITKREWEITAMTSSYVTTFAIGTSADFSASSVRLFARVSAFKFHPAMHVLTYKEGTVANSASFTDGYLNFDVDNYTMLDQNNIDMLHTADLLGLFDVKAVAKF